MPFHIVKNPKPAGDQPKAIQELVSGFTKGNKYQTLLGVTGSGKTFTMAQVIQKLDKPTLVISHNKTLAAQLYEEFKGYFPHDHVKYFVSYYDYYQPEAYLPNSDTYIEKTAEINKEIEQLRHAAVNSLLQHRNTIVVASVSCIYNLGSPQTFRSLSMQIRVGQEITKKELLRKLISSLQYERNEMDFWHGNIRQRDEYIDVWPPGDEIFYRVRITGDTIKEIKKTQAPFGDSEQVKSAMLFPAKFWLSEENMRDVAASNIKLDLQDQLDALQKKKKFLEAERLKRRTNYDLALIKEVGWCKGIENYTRYFENRKKGSAPYTLMDYFPKDYLTIIDESHMTVPQVRGMYNGDKARKETLVDYGFRLPSALDNRPLQFEEFTKKLGQCLFASATPADYEKKVSAKTAEQIVRPTYLLDPEIELRKTEGQIPDVIREIEARTAKKERVLVTVLTKRLSEALAAHLKEKKIKAAFLHSEIETLERPKILMDLRKGVYDVLVGINLLREGLDLPEVSLVAILDADKEGFLRDARSFIQIAGRAARHINGHVLMYADKITKSITEAISETARRRAVQEAYNKKHGTKPAQIIKEIKYTLEDELDKDELKNVKEEYVRDYYKELKQKLELAQRNLQFEKAARIQQQMKEVREKKNKK
jgi:excinuclease ABC subunit B